MSTNSRSTNKSTVLSCFPLLIISYKIRLNCQRKEACNYIAKTDSDEVHLECLSISSVSSCTILFLGGKGTRALFDHLLLYRSEEKERVAIRVRPLWAFRVCSVMKVAITFTILLLLFLFPLFHFAE